MVLLQARSFAHRTDRAAVASRLEGTTEEQIAELKKEVEDDLKEEIKCLHA